MLDAYEDRLEFGVGLEYMFGDEEFVVARYVSGSVEKELETVAPERCVMSSFEPSFLKENILGETGHSGEFRKVTIVLQNWERIDKVNNGAASD